MLLQFSQCINYAGKSHSKKATATSILAGDITLGLLKL